MLDTDMPLQMVAPAKFGLAHSAYVFASVVGSDVASPHVASEEAFVAACHGTREASMALVYGVHLELVTATKDLPTYRAFSCSRWR